MVTNLRKEGFRAGVRHAVHAQVLGTPRFGVGVQEEPVQGGWEGGGVVPRIALLKGLLLSGKGVQRPLLYHVQRLVHKSETHNWNK
jgi:hypothetical protein